MSAFSFTAPQFTEQDVLRERSTFTEEEIQQIESRCLGNVSIDLVEETPALIETGLRDMARHLAAIPNKSAYEEAMLEAPHLVEQESAPIRFLRAEMFNAQAAANRLVKYWEMRKKIFESRAFQSMRLDGAMQDDIETIRLVPDLYFVTGKDDHGRLILFSNKAHLDFNRYSRLSLTRIIWYYIHCHLNDIDVQKKGMVVVALAKINSLNQFDRVQTKLATSSVQEAIPIRIMCAHVCHPPGFLSILYPVFNFIMGKTLRQHFKIHKGSEGHVLKELEKYGIQRNKILTCMGGTYDLKIDEWLNEQQQVEASAAIQHEESASSHNNELELSISNVTIIESTI